MRGGGVERGAGRGRVVYVWETDGVVGVSVSFGLASNMRYTWRWSIHDAHTGSTPRTLVHIKIRWQGVFARVAESRALRSILQLVLARPPPCLGPLAFVWRSALLARFNVQLR